MLNRFSIKISKRRFRQKNMRIFTSCFDNFRNKKAIALRSAIALNKYYMTLYDFDFVC